MCKNVHFAMFLFGLFLCFAANIAIMDLSSSFNIEDGAGTASLAICFGFSLLAALPIPALGRQFGCKRLLIFGEVGYLVYMLGNLHSGFITLVPAGIFLGIGEAVMWTMMPIISTYFARQKLSEGENLEPKIRLYTGYYHAVIELSVVAGSAVSSLVLHIDRNHSPSPVYTNVTKIRDLSVCGANDCQIPNITSANHQQYHPLNEVTKYVVIAIFVAMGVVSMVLFHFFIPNKIPWDSETKEACDPSDKDSRLLDDSKIASECVEKGAAEVVQEEGVKKDTSDTEQNQESKPETSTWSLLVQSVVDTFRLAASTKHLLIVCLTLYNGMTMAFRLSEMPRSLSSCIMGVDTVGICAIIFSVASSFSAYASGKFSERFGRTVPFLCAALVDVAAYSFLLVWEITESNAWLTYVVFFATGLSFSVYNTLVTAMYGEYFLEDHKLAFNLWNIVVSIGLMWQFAASTYLCVYVKIYIQFGLLVCGLVTYLISQAVYYPDALLIGKRPKRKEGRPDDNQSQQPCLPETVVQ